MDEYLNFAKELALEAGEIMMKYFHAEEIGLKLKEDETPVTLADTEINSLVIKRVKEKYPEHGVLGEEESFNSEKENLWVVDPVDGTADFAARIPQFAFSLAYLIKGKPMAAVVYNPITKRLFSAVDGQGAYENGKQIQISEKTVEKYKISSWVVGGIENSVFNNNAIHSKVSETYARMGNVEASDFPIAYALALVASGDFDALISSIRTPWDVAAGGLIAKEAGAVVTDIFGSNIYKWDSPVSGIAAAGPKTHREFIENLAPIVQEYK